ncbi:MAG TPA: hypothetical protein DHV36_02390, partial [Desulfobacteraceae bacterium]|nr:hypothetical protein [Desulfobacteraceae bacterium]
MEINPDVSYQKTNIDLSQQGPSHLLPENKAAQAKGAAGAPLEKMPAGAATVSLSDEGRAASLELDFTDETDIFTKMQALGRSTALGKAHASMSYESVK